MMDDKWDVCFYGNSKNDLKKYVANTKQNNDILYYSPNVSIFALRLVVVVISLRMATA